MEKAVIVFVLNCIILVNSYSVEVPHSPCPSVFSYIYNGKVWAGHILVPAPPKSANIAVILANFSIEGTVTGGKIILDENDEALEKIKNGQSLKFIVTFPKSEYLPKVIQINYNGNNLCDGHPVPPLHSYFWLTYTYKWYGISDSPPHYTEFHQTPQTFHYPQTFVPEQSTPIVYQPPIYQSQTPPIVIYAPPTFKPKPSTLIPYHPPIHQTFNPKTSTLIPYQPPIHQMHNHPTITSKNPVISKPKPFRNYKYCGMLLDEIRPKRDIDYDKRIINGSLIPENSHPWLAAMFDLTKNEFFCAGSLISNKHVLTAAHCTVAKKQSEIQVKLGVHNTKQFLQPGMVARTAKSIVEHPEYREGNAHADMAFIVLNEEVVVTRGVNPICLWNLPVDFRFMVGKPGTIMGWGNEATGVPSSVPMKTEVTIETHQKCKQVDLFRNLVTDETFCAGTKGTGPCMGDSGGGLFLPFDKRWYLRGIISTSIANRNSQICDTSTYSIYVDTGKYMDWIADNMEQN